MNNSYFSFDCLSLLFVKASNELFHSVSVFSIHGAGVVLCQLNSHCIIIHLVFFIKTQSKTITNVWPAKVVKSLLLNYIIN